MIVDVLLKITPKVTIIQESEDENICIYFSDFSNDSPSMLNGMQIFQIFQVILLLLTVAPLAVFR